MVKRRSCVETENGLYLQLENVTLFQAESRVYGSVVQGAAKAELIEVEWLVKRKCRTMGLVVRNRKSRRCSVNRSASRQRV